MIQRDNIVPTRPPQKVFPKIKLRDFADEPGIQEMRIKFQELIQDYFPITTIKCSLKSIIKDSNYVVHFEHIVGTIKRISQYAHYLLNLHIHRCLDQNLPLPDLNDQMLYSHLCRLVSVCNQKIRDPMDADSYLLETATIFKALTPNLPDRRYLGMFINTLAAQIKVEVANHFNLNIANRLSKFIRMKFSISNTYYSDFLARRILYETVKESKFDNYLQTKLILQIFKRYKLDIPKNTDPIKDSQKFIRVYSFLQKDYENTTGFAFSIAPLSNGFCPDYIHLTTSLIPNLLKFVTGKPEGYYKSWSDDNLWEQIINHSKLPKCKGFFGNHISTDNYGASVIFYTVPKDFPVKYRVLKKLSFAKRIELLENYKLIKQARAALNKVIAADRTVSVSDRTVSVSDILDETTDSSNLEENECKYEYSNHKYHYANDPGDRYLFTISCENEGKKRIRCSAEEFNSLTKKKEYRKFLNLKAQQVPELKELNKFSLRISGYERYKSNLLEVLKLSIPISKIYCDIEFRKRRFDAYSHKQRAFSYLTKKIIGDKDPAEIIIGWGTGGNSQARKGNHLPKLEFQKFVERTTKITIEPINEWGTSKSCSCCGSKLNKIKHCPDISRVLINEMDNAKTEKAEKKFIKRWKDSKYQKHHTSHIYAIARCSNNECRITWERDVNASDNILKLLLNKLNKISRPSYLKPKIKESEIKEETCVYGIPTCLPPQNLNTMLVGETLIAQPSLVLEN